MSSTSASGRCFPPRVLPDINIFNVRSSTELGYKLLALQRVAAAALAVYICYCYWPSKHRALSAWVDVMPIGGYCLSAPATFLALGGFYIYDGSVRLVLGVKHKNLERIFNGVWRLAIGYFCCHHYRKIALCIFNPPNLLDKVFVRIGNHLSVPLWKRFYDR
jgi:hypothetical protein